MTVCVISYIEAKDFFICFLSGLYPGLPIKKPGYIFLFFHLTIVKMYAIISIQKDHKGVKEFGILPLSGFHQTIREFENVR